MDFYGYKFFHELKALPFIEEIWVYGSRARKDNQERSDMDIAVICSNASEDDWSKVQKLIEEADTLFKIDCVRFDTLPEGKFKTNTLKFKKVVYKKGTAFMEKEFWQDHFESLGIALKRLNEVITHPDLDKIDYLQDAAIQRFEFCIELYWKVLKKFLAYEKVDTTTPRDVLQKAFQYKFINDEKIWLQMMDDRNRTSHVYQQEVAHDVFLHIKYYLPVMLNTYENLKQKFYAK